MAVMEDRKVFGASGSKTLKELLAEAETPSKKLSARSGAPPASNGAHHAGQARHQNPEHRAVRPLMAPLTAPITAKITALITAPVTAPTPEPRSRLTSVFLHA